MFPPMEKLFDRDRAFSPEAWSGQAATYCSYRANYLQRLSAARYPNIRTRYIGRLIGQKPKDRGGNLVRGAGAADRREMCEPFETIRLAARRMDIGIDQAG
jgi:hypothetical protein